MLFYFCATPKSNGQETETVFLWEVDHRKYRYNMTVTAFLDSEDDTSEVRDGQVFIAAFHKNELRGVAPIQRVPEVDGRRIYLMVYSNVPEGEALTFKIYDSTSDLTWCSKENLEFRANDNVGNLLEPYTLTKAPLTRLDKGYVPKEFTLEQNYPNPFNPTTSFGFGVPVASEVTIEIYNIAGQRVRTMFNEKMDAGFQILMWDSADNYGQLLSSGIYFIRMQAKAVDSRRLFQRIRKVILLR